MAIPLIVLEWRHFVFSKISLSSLAQIKAGLCFSASVSPTLVMQLGTQTPSVWSLIVWNVMTIPLILFDVERPNNSENFIISGTDKSRPLFPSGYFTHAHETWQTDTPGLWLCGISWRYLYSFGMAAFLHSDVEWPKNSENFTISKVGIYFSASIFHARSRNLAHSYSVKFYDDSFHDDSTSNRSTFLLKNLTISSFWPQKHWEIEQKKTLFSEAARLLKSICRVRR